MRWLALLLLLLPGPALAETYSGSAYVVDGDTVIVNQTRLRLLSMDAFESAQNCSRDGQTYPCGLEATRALIGLIGQREVRCDGDKRDRYGRPLVQCFIGDLDLGREMVRQGWAVAEYGAEYRADEETAQKARAGAWEGEFKRPIEWRRLRPR